jgi:hypothetical protein
MAYHDRYFTLEDEYKNQAVIDLWQPNLDQKKYPNPCPYIWRCKTPGAFRFPDYITADTLLGTEQVNFKPFFSGTDERLIFYYLTDKGDRVDVFTIWDMYSFSDFWNNKGEGAVHWVTAAKLRSGACKWELLD